MKEKLPKELQKEFFERFAVLITGAFTFVAGLAWNSAIQALIEQYIGPGKSLLSQFIYAVTITLIAILVIHQVNVVQKNLEQTEKTEEKK